MFMSLIFTTVGPAADYGSIGRYLLLVCTISEFANIQVFVLIAKSLRSQFVGPASLLPWPSRVRPLCVPIQLKANL